MLRCVQCDTELVAPIRSEYWSDNHACHVWHCPKCCACFSSLVSFLTKPTQSRCCMLSRFAQQLRQLGNIRRDPPCLIFREQLGRRAPADLSFCQGRMLPDFALGRETATAR